LITPKKEEKNKCNPESAIHDMWAGGLVKNKEQKIFIQPRPHGSAGGRIRPIKKKLKIKKIKKNWKDLNQPPASQPGLATFIAVVGYSYKLQLPGTVRKKIGYNFVIF
jgi:hypothetical protein